MNKHIAQPTTPADKLSLAAEFCVIHRTETIVKRRNGMSLNPIVALSEQFQKLINEHGSAAILRDHLALFKDQVLMLEKENLCLNNKSGVYKISEEKLKSNIEHLQKENEILRSKIQEYEQSTHDNLLNETTKNILNELFKTNREITINSLTKLLGGKENIVHYHIDLLIENKLISKGPRMLNEPTT